MYFGVVKPASCQNGVYVSITPTITSEERPGIGRKIAFVLVPAVIVIGDIGPANPPGKMIIQILGNPQGNISTIPIDFTETESILPQ